MIRGKTQRGGGRATGPAAPLAAGSGLTENNSVRRVETLARLRRDDVSGKRAECMGSNNAVSG